jgi:uncharacterized membrane protein
MSEKIFYLIVKIIYVISVFPFLLSIYYSLKKSPPPFFLFSIICVELIIGSSNFLLYIYGYGRVEIQFIFYDLIEIITWNFLIYSLSKSKKTIQLQLLLLLIILYCIWFYKLGSVLEIYAKLLQMFLGIKLLLSVISTKAYDNTNSHNFILLTSIGLLIYSLVCINNFIFKDLLVGLTISSFALSWLSHQFAALVYISLLFVSVWKSQEV